MAYEICWVIQNDTWQLKFYYNGVIMECALECKVKLGERKFNFQCFGCEVYCGL